mmetsp:Transcript_29855/g.85469  ORF Transcript_29855/g.85469 Transcript_29855/m.85469 type:complete len:206 (+) Transcript_29855:1200-1817(+)
MSSTAVSVAALSVSPTCLSCSSPTSERRSQTLRRLFSTSCSRLLKASSRLRRIFSTPSSLDCSLVSHCARKASRRRSSPRRRASARPRSSRSRCSRRPTEAPRWRTCASSPGFPWPAGRAVIAPLLPLLFNGWPPSGFPRDLGANWRSVSESWHEASSRNADGLCSADRLASVWSSSAATDPTSKLCRCIAPVPSRSCPTLHQIS